MVIFFKTQIKLLFTVICFFILHHFNAQDAKHDTLSQIYKYQTTVNNARLTQYFGLNRYVHTTLKSVNY
jgi:hypothetical protein